MLTHSWQAWWMRGHIGAARRWCVHIRKIGVQYNSIASDDPSAALIRPPVPTHKLTFLLLEVCVKGALMRICQQSPGKQINGPGKKCSQGRRLSPTKPSLLECIQRECRPFPSASEELNRDIKRLKPKTMFLLSLCSHTGVKWHQSQQQSDSTLRDHPPRFMTVRGSQIRRQGWGRNLVFIYTSSTASHTNLGFKITKYCFGAKHFLHFLKNSPSVA